MDADLKRDMEYLQRKTSSDKWHKQMIQHFSEKYGVDDDDEIEKDLQSVENAPLNVIRVASVTLENERPWVVKSNITSRLPNWKVDEILNHYVNGEAYFIGDQRKWKEIVLNSFELIYHDKISIPQLLQKIKEQGIEFKQSQKIMSYPIKEYLQFISKKIKKDIKS